ncbi:MAG: hypothetical protein KAU14_02970 [Thermoplasmata archaeon]|nr:hypothetical protein [Thermoplasmata archaeon]
MEKCKINISNHPLKRSVERGVDFETIMKIIENGNDIKGKYKYRKYRKLGKIVVSFIQKPCNIFVVTILRG